jgi:hypothetical protein
MLYVSEHTGEEYQKVFIEADSIKDAHEIGLKHFPNISYNTRLATNEEKKEFETTGEQ